MGAIVARGHRYYGAPEREQAIEGLAGRFRPFSNEVTFQRLPVPHPNGSGSVTLVNIRGKQHAEQQRRLIVATHWDTRLWAEEDPDPSRRELPIPGANDGTSGIAVMLELARALHQAPLRHFGVDYVLFDGEEFGRPGTNDYCQGSRYLAGHLTDWYPNELPEAAIVMDMVGDKDLGILEEQYSRERASWLYETVLSAAADRGERAFSGQRRMAIVDDHVALLESGIPAILLIDYDYPYWHTHGDTMEQCSPDSLARVGNVLLDTLRRLDDAAVSGTLRSPSPTP